MYPFMYLFIPVRLFVYTCRKDFEYGCMCDVPILISVYPCIPSSIYTSVYNIVSILVRGGFG